MPSNIDFSNTEDLVQYITALTSDSKKLRHANYEENIEHKNEMAVHINGDKPTKLLSTRRPNEPDDVYNYRLSIYEPITKSKTKKIINTLSRIKSSKNFSIIFPEKESNKIADDETLEKYVLEDYPFFGSITEWLFRIVLKQDLVDPNSIIAFLPLNLFELTEDDNSLPEPYGVVYGTEQVIDFVTDEYYTILLEERSKFTVNGVEKDGDIIHVYNKENVIQFFQTGIGEGGKKIFEISVLWQHNLGVVPVVETRGEYVDTSFPFRYESYISGILPYFNEAVRIYSDHQAQLVQHMYLERVEIQVECDNTLCGSGDADPGYIRDGNKYIQCSRCEGKGTISGRSPYGTTIVKKEDAISIEEGGNTIFPGVQYVSKPVEIVEEVRKEIDINISEGMAAVNMDILNNVGENQSGKAKQIDRTDMDLFISEVSNNIFRILDESIQLINMIRYGFVLGPDFRKQLPAIVKPVSFDVISSNILMNEISQASDADVDDFIIDKLNEELIDKRFNNPKITKMASNVIELDPLSGKSEDDKALILASGGVTKEEYIISVNIKGLIARAVEEDEGFLDKPRSEKMEILKSFVEVPKTATILPIVDNNGLVE